ncbi:MAG: CpXC domain-containing protein [Acutalibacteraceae bacterium]
MADGMTGETRRIACPCCGKEIEASVYPIVNIKRSPQLREKILDESLFRSECSVCGKPFRLISRCLYHDEEKNFMVYLIPGFHGKKLETGGISQEYPEFSTAACRVVSNLNQLKEKILLMEFGVDDRAIEIAKLAVSGIVAKKYDKRIQAAYFCRLNEETDRIGFSFFLDGEAQPVFYQTHAEVYRYAKEVAEEFPLNGFMNVDVRWAARALDISRRSSVGSSAE